jgi:serine acetyltransferase
VLVGVEIDEDAVAGEEVSLLVIVVVGADIKAVGEEVSVSAVVVVGADVEIVGEVILISMEVEQSTP